MKSLALGYTLQTSFSNRIDVGLKDNSVGQLLNSINFSSHHHLELVSYQLCLLVDQELRVAGLVEHRFRKLSCIKFN